MPTTQSQCAAASRAPHSPLGALLRGLAAGALASAAQEVFFRATGKLAPAPPEGVFEPPEPEQATEPPTETVARRAAELTRRELPIDQRHAGRMVHYAFGSAWGAAYGLSAATYPALTGAAGGAAFGAVVWAVSEGLILPAFRLSAWPQRYPLGVHAYSIAAHLAYGGALGLAFDALTPRRGLRDETLVRASDAPAEPPPPPMRIHAPDMLEAGAGI